ncbi:MAG: 5'-nucleotidase, partial [Lysinibacillus sp.]
AITGAQIRLAIEQCAAVLAVNAAGDIDFSFNVYPNELHPYIYDYWGGVDYTLNLSKPIGQRIEQLTVKGTPLEDTKTYRVVMNSYRATGVEFPMFQQQPCLFESDEILPAIIMNHIQKRQTIHYISHGTITITV